MKRRPSPAEWALTAACAPWVRLAPPVSSWVRERCKQSARRADPGQALRPRRRCPRRRQTEPQGGRAALCSAGHGRGRGLAGLALSRASRQEHHRNTDLADGAPGQGRDVSTDQSVGPGQWLRS